jgi:hypothetical protein
LDEANKMAKTMKRRLSSSEEFEVMKMVLDKFLWLGVIIMGYGFFVSISQTIAEGVYYLVGGALLLIIFAWFVVKEFEQLR